MYGQNSETINMGKYHRVLLRRVSGTRVLTTQQVVPIQNKVFIKWYSFYMSERAVTTESR